MSRLLALALTTATTLSFSTPALADHHGEAPAADPALTAALASDVRADDQPRDKYRHPAETLTFFGVKPGMSVVDFLPSGGWYTRVLVPYLGEEGTYIGMNPNVDGGPEFFQRMANLNETLPGQVSETFGETGATPIGINSGSIPEELKGTVDRALIFREIHNIRRLSWLFSTLTDIRTLLKDDGLVGVVQHRAKSNAPGSYTDGNMGYQREKDVIGLFEAHGFDLVATSEINANPKDPADHPGGVWTLAPGFRGATDETRPALVELGESDRMTLLFRKRP